MPQPEANLRRVQASSGAWVATGLDELDLWTNTEWMIFGAFRSVIIEKNKFLIHVLKTPMAYSYFAAGFIDVLKPILAIWFDRLAELPFLEIKQRRHWKVDQRLKSQIYCIEQPENWIEPDSVRGVLHGLGLLERFDDTGKCFLSGVELGGSFTEGLLNIPSLKHDPLPIRISSEISTAETEPCWVSGYPVKLFERNLEGSVVINAIPITRGYLRLLTYLFADSGCERGVLDLNQWKPVFFRPIFWQAKP